MSIDKSKSSTTKQLCCRCGKNKRFNGGRRCRSCQDIVNARQKELRASRRSRGLCTCGRQPPEAGSDRCTLCKLECSTSKNVTARRRKQAGLCECGKRPPTGMRSCDDCRAADKKRRIAERRAVFEYYGLACTCCGEDMYEFLEIDHIEGNGNDHRREIGYYTIYRWLISNNFPAGFQTLCANCNRAKFRYGCCPHQRQPATILKIAE